MRTNLGGQLGVALALALGCGGDSTPSHAESAEPAKPQVRAPPQSVSLGDLSELSPSVRRAFESHPDDFPPLREPGPGDWLSFHPEPPQSVSNYVVDGPNRPGDEGRDTLYILPLGELPDLTDMQAFAGDFFTMPVVVLPPANLDPAKLTRRTRGSHEQVLATDLQAHLQANLPEDAYAMIGLTMEDLYPSDDYNYVFGLASVSRRTGVFSLARYDPRFYDPMAPANPQLQRERGFKILAHEMGHMFGMHHCVHASCLMNGANHDEELDAAPLALCAVCLRKLHIATDFEPKSRYEALGARYDRVGLREAAAFVRTRIRRIDAE